jgi:general secretion pathway protein A
VLDEFAAGVAEGYERYFGLAEAPFKLTSSPRFLFESSSYLAAFKEVEYALSRHEPIIVVTGPIGTGKTTLCRMIGERRGPRTVVAVISTPPQTRDDLFRQALDGFGLLTDDTKHVVEASHFGLLKVFQQFFDSLVALKAQAILVFDEAQHLRPDILEEIRLLSNVDTDHQTLQIVLVGQPELDELLARTELGQVQQRVSRRHRLAPLQLSEVAAYVDRRLSVAQSDQPSGDRPTFTESAIQAIAAVSHGVPRVINIVCDRALESAWSNRTHSVDRAAVLRAAASLNIEAPPTFAPRPFEPAPKPAAVDPTSKPGAGVPAPTSLRLKRSHAQIAVAAVVAVSVLLAWMFRGGANDPVRTVTPQQAVVRDAARSASTDRPSPSAAVPPVVASETLKPAAVSAKPAVASVASSAADKFLIIVSSFRTRDRSAKVAADIVALGLPATVRSTSGWEQVVVGPYSTRQEAAGAQDRLEDAHFTDMKIVQAGPPTP